MKRAACVLSLLAACSRADDPEARSTAFVVVIPEGNDSLRVDSVRHDAPNGAVDVETLGRGVMLSLSLARDAVVNVTAEGFCPIRIDPKTLEPGKTQRIAVRPLLDFPAPIGQAGYDAPIDLVVEPGCDVGAAGEIRWRQVGGAPLSSLETSNRGYRLRARTPKLEETVPQPLPWGVVPISALSRGESVLEAWWDGGGGREIRRRVHVSAATRSTGLPNVPTGSRLFLGGGPWRLVDAEPEGGAVLEERGGVETFLPHAAGRWTLEDAAQRTLTIAANRLDRTPLDCGRSDCHRAETESATTSPMTTVFQRHVSGHLADARDPSCAVGCHTLGDPGAEDGGFWHVASELAATLPPPGRDAWHALPRALRRLGSVGCLACHGPAAIPEPSARWAILRTDVCATCHDAPPRYGHVAAWRSSKMARSDADPSTRGGACASCHTTAGFLARAAGDEVRAAPAEVGPIGIACAACHAVHPPGRPAEASLVRDIAAPDWMKAPIGAFGTAVGRLCLDCHGPHDAPLPEASAGPLLLGTGGLDPDSGKPLNGPAPHAGAPGGCVGCHDRGPSDLERGAGHGFVADPTRCTPCHGGRAVDETLPERAAALYDALARHNVVQRLTPGEDRPPHASAQPKLADSPLSRAAHNVRLVLEDRAAHVHNPAYARTLLDSAARALGMAPSAASEREPAR